MFADMDKNNDSKLSREEVKAYFGGDDKSDMFKGEDANSDGFISWAEFTGPKGKSDPKDEL